MMISRHQCRRCHADVIHTFDDPDVAGLPITINPNPTTVKAALVAIVGGYRVVYANPYKRDRGAGVGKEFRHWRPPQYTADFDKPLHIEHRCGVTDPPPPPPPQMTWPDDSTPPPF